MKIEIVTTKKKISKSLVNQMQPAGLFELQLGKTLGYMVNVIKDQNKTMLIEYNNNYYTISCAFIRVENNPLRITRGFNRNIDFKDAESLELWWGHYQDRLKEGRVQIYV